jgi:CheY-like chemotaxis protein
MIVIDATEGTGGLAPSGGTHPSGALPGASAAVARGILVVDDNPAMTRGLSLLLRQAGYSPIVFNGALPALEYLSSCNCNKPAAAVIDIHLPDLSGLVLSQRVRELLGPAAPIIALSGDGSMEILNSLSLVGATYFFRKPVQAAQLLQRLRELVG